MNRLLKSAWLAAIAVTLTWIPTQVQAQGGGGGGRNFDPEQMRQRMMDRYKEALQVKSDDEWKVFEPRIQKILDARRQVGVGGMGRGMFGRAGGGGGGGGGGGAGGGDAAATGGQGGGRRGGGGFGGTPSPAAQDLQKAVDSGASADQIKAKLAAYREDRQQKQADLEKAQGDLKKLLSVKQEAAAVLVGLLE